jgi:uncharacterized protein YegL
MMRRPGGELATRPLHFIWITDCSGSMKSNGKIQALNTAIREAIPHMQRVADENPNADVLVRAIRFASGAQWHLAQETPVSQFKWSDLSAGGTTDMGKALTMVAEQLKIPPMSERALPPVLALVSDGQPTDNFPKGLAALMEQPWGKKAVRIAIAIGEDADHEVLRKFIGHPEIEPLQANNPEALVNYIRWVSTAVLQAASSPASQVSPPDQTAPQPSGATSIGQSGMISPSSTNVPASTPAGAGTAGAAPHVAIPAAPAPVAATLSAASDVW